MISVSHLTKRYGAHLAVADVSFEIGQGQVVGFLGPNGAGKSTTLRVLAGFLGPTSGKVRVAGYDVVDDSFEARRAIGYMPEAVPLYPEMRVVEYLRFRAELKRVGRAQRAAYVGDAMERAGVLDVANKRIAHLSKGYRQRVGLADAIVAKPPIVVLDEPTAGLDPNQIREARALVRELGRDHTVVLSTHILSEVESCATRVLVLHRGKLVAQGPTEDLRALGTSNVVDFGVAARDHTTAAGETLRAVEAVSHVEQDNTPASAQADGPGACAPYAASATRFRVTFRGPISFAERERATERCVHALVLAGFGVHEVRASGGTLEDVFASLTRDDPARADGDKGGPQGIAPGPSRSEGGPEKAYDATGAARS